MPTAGQILTATGQVLENRVGAIIPDWQYQCPFCKETSPTSCGISASWVDPKKVGRGQAVKITAVCTKSPAAPTAPAPIPATTKYIDPKENYVGNTVSWDGFCPFCRQSTVGGRAQCGWRGDTICKILGSGFNKYDVKILNVCTNVASAPGKPANNPNGPHNNVVGAAYTPTGKSGCPFCGEAKTDTAKGGWLCGSDMRNGRVTVPCPKFSSGQTLVLPQDAKKNANMSISLLPSKPKINCPACGAYAADSHRRGCRAGVI